MLKQPIIALLCTATLSPAIIAGEKTTLKWSDDFSAPTIDTSAWRITEGNGCPEICGFGNNELQTYGNAKQNLRIEDGKLVIEAHKGEKFTSAKLTTQNMPGWQYGKISVRAKLPTGVGTWPAIWMLPDANRFGGWPKSGEIDIMEHVGFNQNHIHGTIHTEAYNHRINTQKGGEIDLDTASSAFHTYTIEWTKDDIRWSIDGNEYFRFAKETNDTSAEWPFDQPFHLILNLAVGGDWGGREGVNEAAFPARFEIDWVKVWQ